VVLVAEAGGALARAIRVFDLNPVGAPPRPIGPISPLGYDPFGAQRAGVAEDRLAVAVEVLGQADAAPSR